MVKIWELGVGLKLENGSLDQLTRDIQQKLEQSWEVAGEKAWKWIKKWLDQKQATSELARDIEQKVWNAGEKAGNKLQQSIWWGLKALVGLGVAKALQAGHIHSRGISNKQMWPLRRCSEELMQQGKCSKISQILQLTLRLNWQE